MVSRHLDKKGRGKLVEACTLPLTARRCVDTLITERALFRKREGRLVLESLAPGVSREAALEGIPDHIETASAMTSWEV